MKEIREALEKIYCALDLERKIVGVKFLMNKEEYDAEPTEACRARMPYCVLVEAATRGRERKAMEDHFGCLSAARAFGMVRPTDYWIGGEFYRDKGMYCDLGTSRNVVQKITCCAQSCYGILVKPLENFESRPDVVLIVADTYDAMRLIQGYTYTYGTCDSFKFAGIQAMCAESTAYPHESQHINVSLLCAGTRYKANWGRNELCIGLPFKQFCGMAEGLYATVNAMEPDADKERIRARLRETGREDLEIVMHENYHTGCYRT